MVPGLSEIATGPAVMVTVATADLVQLLLAVAVTCTTARLGSVAGAVYNPVTLTVPTVASPPEIPLTLQETLGSDPLVTDAVNCCEEPEATELVRGLTLIDTGATRVTCEEAKVVKSASDRAWT
jgi:hypothetical protein